MKDSWLAVFQCSPVPLTFIDTAILPTVFSLSMYVLKLGMIPCTNCTAQTRKKQLHVCGKELTQTNLDFLLWFMSCLRTISVWPTYSFGGLPRTTLEMTKGAWHPNRTRWTREHLQPFQFMWCNSGATVKSRQTSWWEQTMCGRGFTTPETLWIEPIGKPTTTKSHWSGNTWFSADRLHSRKTALHTDT